MDRMLPHDLQTLNEQTYSRQHIDSYIKEEILNNDVMVEKIEEGVRMLSDWMEGDYYESKNHRLAQLVELDLEALIVDIFIGVAYCQIPELFTSITSQLASRLKFSEKEDGIKTIAEILAVLCYTDAFDIIKPDQAASLLVQSKIPISDKLIRYVENSNYLPPMVCEPRTLQSNYQSAYLTHNDSLILGSGNHHNGDICLDVLNSKNKVALKLDEEFLCCVEENPTFEIDTADKWSNWHRFKSDSYKFYLLMVGQGNRFHLTHKVDKRGRIYSQGYHITTQGSAFKKAIVELADEEYINGVPS
jgi:hypothetical protein